ncbi:MAG: hypothetical protein RDU89_02850 [bacterium]|nr:hypothetical protein [bacterium]
MIGDTVTLGMVAGTIGNLAKDLSNYLLYRRKVTTEVYPRVAASLFTDSGSARRPAGFAVGLITDGLIGAGAGIPLAYVLTRTGKDNYLLKGIGVGLALWSLFYGGLGGKLSIRPRDPPTLLSGFWNNALYGAVTAFAITRLASPRLFRR